MGIIDFLKRKEKPDDGQTAARQWEDLGVETAKVYPLASGAALPDVEALKQDFDTRLAAMKAAGTCENCTQLKFQGYALDCMDFVGKNFNKELTFSEEDLSFVEKFAEKIREAYHDGKMDREKLHDYAKMVAGYFGLLLIHHKGGEWVEQADELPEAGPAVVIGTAYYFILSKAFRRLENGDEDNLLYFYQSIPYRQ